MSENSELTVAIPLEDFLELNCHYIIVLTNIYSVLEKANKEGQIVDTLWFNKYTTLFDYITNAIMEGGSIVNSSEIKAREGIN